MLETFPDNISNKEKEVIGDDEEFHRRLEMTAVGVTEEEIRERLSFLEQLVKSPYRNITLFSDPSIGSFCCGIIPDQHVNEKGEIVTKEDSDRYMIGVPQIYIAGDAGKDFLRGEIIHEQGHAYWTNFKILEELERVAVSEGYSKSDMHQLLNVLEDPRMERLQGGPLHESVRKLLFEKNKQFIIPNLAKAVQSTSLSRKDKLYFLIKLEQIWQLHIEELKDVTKPWNIEEIDPDVYEAFKRIKKDLDIFTGTNTIPPTKRSGKIKEMVENIFWPVVKELIDKDKDDPIEESEKKEQGEQGEKGNPNLETDMLDPKNIEAWPDDLKKAFQQALENEKKELEKKSKEKKEEYQKKQEQDNLNKLINHERLSEKDGFNNPEAREKYNDLLRELRPIISKLKRIFDRYVPISDDNESIYSRHKGKYRIRKHLREMGTGNENPMEKKNIPQDKAVIIQLLIDVSGSMFNDNRERINNAMKTAIAIAEACAESNVYLQILANDDKNFSQNSDYKIFDFNDSIKRGNIREKIIELTNENKFGGGNKDAEAIDEALEELKKKTKKLQGKHDRLASLMLYISDATTPDQSTRNSVDKARGFTVFEGTAITPEADVVKAVKEQFGSDSLVPESINNIPDVISHILRRNLLKLK